MTNQKIQITKARKYETTKKTKGRLIRAPARSRAVFAFFELSVFRAFVIGFSSRSPHFQGVRIPGLAVPSWAAHAFFRCSTQTSYSFCTFPMRGGCTGAATPW
jgi:hypothetical protein